MITKTFNEPAITILSRPAKARILIDIDLAGDPHLRSTLNEEETLNYLDKAMEAIDGQRLPPANG